MSHEIKIHEAQTSILRELLFLPEAGFAELQKPTGLASDHFTFHINRLVEIGLVERTDRGKYTLTTAGKEYANRLDTEERTIERQAKIGVLLVPLRQRGDQIEYMVQKRLKQPYYGYHCFMTGKLRWGETIEQGALRELMEEAGLRARVKLVAINHKMDYDTDGNLLEDKHFYVLSATELEGDFTEKFDGGENYWLTLDEITKLERKFEGMANPPAWVEHDTLQFIEKKFTVRKEDY